MGSISTKIREELIDFKYVLRMIPGSVVALFVVSVVLMNLLANKEIQTGLPWMALDCGILVSWMSFLSMDIITKRFGAKASIKVSAFALGVNLLVCIIMYGASMVPGNWGEFYNSNSDQVNLSLNATIGGTWYVLLGSTISMFVASVVNSTLNVAVGALFKNKGRVEFFTRSYVSTLVGQITDNLLFALIVSHVFFGWTLTQCFTCAIVGAIVELLCEVIFSPIGYRVCRRWERDKVGQEYIDYLVAKSSDISGESSDNGTVAELEEA